MRSSASSAPSSSSPAPASGVLHFEPFTLDADNARLLRQDRLLDVPPKAFDVLFHLATQAGQLVRKEALLDAVWGHRHVSESVLKGVVSQLRAVLGDDARQPGIIETVSRRGYRFLPAVRRSGAPMAAADAVVHASASAHVPALGPAPAAALAAVDLPPAEPFIGREAALRQLDAAWDAARAGRAQVVLVGGEPGIGKSTLVDRFCRRLGGVSVAMGQCVDAYGAGEPYLPVLEALNTLCSADPGQLALVREIAPTWLLQMPWHLSVDDRIRLASAATGVSAGRMVSEMSVLLARTCARRPVVLVLEDLHWSDPATIRLLDHLARRRLDAPLMVIGTFRPADVIAQEHVLGDLRRELRLHGLCREIFLEGLSAGQIEAYLAERLGDLRAGQAASSAPFVEALLHHTDGLPLFLASVVDELIEQGVVTVDAAAGWSLAGFAGHRLPVPDNLVGVIDKQLSRVSAESVRLLEAAAVVGAQFDDRTLAEVLDADPADVLSRLEALAAHRLWLRSVGFDPRRGDHAVYAFEHALHRHVLRSRLSATARGHLHRRIGAALERQWAGETDAIAFELASHADAGNEPARAAGWYARAAVQAMKRLAQDEALTLIDRGLALIAPLPAGTARATELTLLSIRISAQMVSAGHGLGPAARTADRALAVMSDAPASPAAGPLWHAIWWVYLKNGQWTRCKRVNGRLFELAAATGDGRCLAAAHAQRGILAMYAGESSSQLDEARDALQQAVDCHPGDQPTATSHGYVHDLLIESLSYLGVLLEMTGRFGEARAVRDRILRRLDAGTDPLSENTGLWFIGFCHALRGELDALAEISVRSAQRMAGRDALSGAGAQEVLRGWLGVVRAQAPEDTEAALQEGRRGLAAYASQEARIGMGTLYRLLSDAHRRAGRLDEAATLLRQAADQRTCDNEAGHETGQLRMHAQWLVSCGADAATIRRCFGEAIASARRRALPLFELICVTELAEWSVAASAGDDWRAPLARLLASIEADPTMPVWQRARRLAGPDFTRG